MVDKLLEERVLELAVAPKYKEQAKMKNTAIYVNI